MESIIEDYRGHEIRFNTETETFVCDIDDSRSVKKSYPALKKFIDDFIKDNYEFKQFSVVEIPNGYNSEKVRKIIGIRKDDRFVFQGENGKTEQFADYDLDRYMLIDEENETQWQKLKSVIEQINKLQKEQREIKKGFKITTLKSVKQNYIIR